jgi:hypothetical protein
MFNSMMMLSGQTKIFKNITISSDQVDWNLITDGFGGIAPSKLTIVSITINSGVEITSSSTSIYPMDLRGLPNNSQITLINNSGEVMGTGGAGGKGEDINSEADF